MSVTKSTKDLLEFVKFYEKFNVALQFSTFLMGTDLTVALRFYTMPKAMLQ